ncbi:Uncharacterised protein [Streptococcus pyogenes]|nr:Uncharacterised protein [Streptococcus pyogenes]
MTLTRSLPTQHASGLPILDERRIYQGRYARNADGSTRLGVLPAHANPLVTGRASMGYDIGAFNAVTARTAAGVEEIANDGTITAATTPAPGSNSRIDVIWVRSLFSTPVSSDVSNDVVFGVTQGTPSASPAKPSIPAGALELATAEIPSTATTTLSSGVVITQTSPFTAAAGGVVWLRSAADAWAAPDGASAYRLDTKRIVDRVAGVWVSRGASAAVRTSTAQATSGSAFAPLAVTWNLEDYDTDGMHSTVSNTSRLVAPAEGDYHVTGKIRGLSTVYATGVQLGKNGVVDPAARQIVTPIAGAGAGSFPTVSKTFHLLAGDYIEVFSLGEAASLSLHPADCFAEMVRVG